MKLHSACSQTSEYSPFQVLPHSVTSVGEPEEAEADLFTPYGVLRRSWCLAGRYFINTPHNI